MKMSFPEMREARGGVIVEIGMTCVSHILSLLARRWGRRKTRQATHGWPVFYAYPKTTPYLT